MSVSNLPAITATSIADIAAFNAHAAPSSANTSRALALSETIQTVINPVRSGSVADSRSAGLPTDALIAILERQCQAFAASFNNIQNPVVRRSLKVQFEAIIARSDASQPIKLIQQTAIKDQTAQCKGAWELQKKKDATKLIRQANTLQSESPEKTKKAEASESCIKTNGGSASSSSSNSGSAASAAASSQAKSAAAAHSAYATPSSTNIDLISVLSEKVQAVINALATHDLGFKPTTGWKALSPHFSTIIRCMEEIEPSVKMDHIIQTIKSGINSAHPHVWPLGMVCIMLSSTGKRKVITGPNEFTDTSQCLEMVGVTYPKYVLFHGGRFTSGRLLKHTTTSSIFEFSAIPFISNPSKLQLYDQITRAFRSISNAAFTAPYEPKDQAELRLKAWALQKEANDLIEKLLDSSILALELESDPTSSFEKKLQNKARKLMFRIDALRNNRPEDLYSTYYLLLH